MENNKNTVLKWVGVCLMGITLAFAVFLFLSSFLKNAAYDRHFEKAETAYLDEDYEEAAKHLTSAIEKKGTDAAYLLLADCYTSTGDLDKAIEVLYVGYSKLGSTDISARLEKLKKEKAVILGIQTTGVVTIGDMTIPLEEVALLLSQKGLEDDDIGAIENLTGLKSLSLDGNRITDLTPLGSLYGLESLNLSGNVIHDLSPLSKLTGLKTLYLDGNPVSDFEPLCSLTGLTTLSLKNIPINSVQLEQLEEALPGCKIYCGFVETVAKELTLGGVTFLENATELQLRSLGIEDISVLSACTALTKLDLRDNDITDLSPLVDLQELSWLCVWENEVSDLGPLLSLKKLYYLDLDTNLVRDISILPGIASLRELWLTRNPVEDFSALSKMTNLSKLGLLGTGITDEDLPLLYGLTNLTELDLENNTLSRDAVDALKDALPNCRVKHSELIDDIELGEQTFRTDADTISVIGEGISDIAVLEKCKNLAVLDLGGNEVYDLSPLSGLAKLHTLCLSGNAVTEFSPLESCPALQNLDLSANAIFGLSGIEGLTQLKTLKLDDNWIDDLSPLCSLTGLTELSINGNAISDDQYVDLKEALPNCVIYCDGLEDIYG